MANENERNPIQNTMISHRDRILGRLVTYHSPINFFKVPVVAGNCRELSVGKRGYLLERNEGYRTFNQLAHY